jgi:hypothetical protein
MAKNEKTGAQLGKIASKALRSPSSLTNSEIRKLGGTALTQRPDNSKGKKRGK